MASLKIIEDVLAFFTKAYSKFKYWGRPILAALNMLLRESCSAATPSEARLPALLRRSREYQSTVSTTLAQQVLDSLYELLRGFQSAPP